MHDEPFFFLGKKEKHKKTEEKGNKIKDPFYDYGRKTQTDTDLFFSADDKSARYLPGLCRQYVIHHHADSNWRKKIDKLGLGMRVKKIAPAVGSYQSVYEQEKNSREKEDKPGIFEACQYLWKVNALERKIKTQDTDSDS